VGHVLGHGNPVLGLGHGQVLALVRGVEGAHAVRTGGVQREFEQRNYKLQAGGGRSHA